MARPREFDEKVVLDAAVQCFWARGYEATSVRDLAHNMNITAASLYNAFGDKRTLYRRALDHYVENSFADRVQRFETLPARDAIEAFLNELIERSLSDPQHKGCMLVNSALEAAPNDPEFQRAVADTLMQMQAFFYRSVKAGQQAGTITRAQPAKDLACLLLGVLLGIRVLARTLPERDLLEGLLRPALALLDSHKPKKGKH